MKNPFHTNKVIIIFDPTTNEEVIIDRINIGKYFRHVYCMCSFDSTDYSIIGDAEVDDNVFNTMMGNMVLYRANISIVRNLFHYSNLIYCEKEYIVHANKFNYRLDENVLILPVVNIPFLSLQQYIDNINGMYGLNKLYDILILNNYFGDDLTSICNKYHINNLIRCLDEANYWALPYNCLLNLTKVFDKRQFNFNIIRHSADGKINNLIEQLSNSAIKENYIEQIFNSKNYVDPSVVINQKGYKLYSKVWSCEYTKKDIDVMFNKLDSYQQTLLFNMLCVSKQYCHLVVANEYILSLMTQHIHSNINIYCYIFGYAWLRLYFEETINRFNVKTNDMYIFDIDTASKLPVFHFNLNDPLANPYCALIVSYNSLQPNSNIGGVSTNYIHNEDRRICNLNEFKERMNIFVSNDRTIDLFEGIDFKQMKIAISGSIMTACAQYKHPLLYVPNYNGNDMNELYSRYFNEYYYESDIDIMVASKDQYELMDITREFHNMLLLNLCKYKTPNADIKYVVMKTTYLFVTQEFIQNYICTANISYDTIVKNLHNNTVKKLFIPFARELHDNECNEKLQNYTSEEQLLFISKYSDIFTFNEENLVVKLHNIHTHTTMVSTNNESELSQDEIDIILNTTHNNEEKLDFTMKTLNGVNLSNNYKIRISSSQLVHDIEMFPSKKEDFMTTVANFHMPCVRAYYNGNVYMTPSFITAHMTLMNIDYKYFAGCRDPIEIINKYRMRGFGTWLNKTEIQMYIKYCYEVPFWKNLLELNDHRKHTYEKCLGYIDRNSNMFKPRKQNAAFITNPKIVPISDVDPYSTNLTTTQYKNAEAYNNNRFVDAEHHLPSKYTTINQNDGYIYPLKIHLIDSHAYSGMKDSNTESTKDDIAA